MLTSLAVVHAVDQAPYAAKRAGRNGVRDATDVFASMRAAKTTKAAR